VYVRRGGKKYFPCGKVLSFTDPDYASDDTNSDTDDDVVIAVAPAPAPPPAPFHDVTGENSDVEVVAAAASRSSVVDLSQRDNPDYWKRFVPYIEEGLDLAPYFSVAAFEAWLVANRHQFKGCPEPQRPEFIIQVFMNQV
jgi:hypothetical protein